MPETPKPTTPEPEFIEVVEEVIALRYVVLAALVTGAVVFLALYWYGQRQKEE